MSKQNNDKTISALEEDLLTPLANKRSLYGLQFVEAFRQASGGKRELGLGSLYPTLARLEKEGLVNWHWGDELIGARRKYYEITAYGEKALKERTDFRENIRNYSASTKSETLDVETQSVEKDSNSIQLAFSQK